MTAVSGRDPDFLLIGAAQSGTTTLYQWLLEHPEIYVPASKRPEPHYFLKSAEFAQGLDYYRSRWFGGRTTELVAGEASTSYMYHPAALPRVAEYLPFAKLVCILRNPVHRAYSNYWHTRRAGLEDLTFEQALGREEERLRNPQSKLEGEIRPFAYVDRGRYCVQLERCFELFKRERVLVLLFDDLVDRPRETARRVFNFLAVDADFAPPSLHRVQNSTTTPDRPALEHSTLSQLHSLLDWESRRLEKLLGLDLSRWYAR